MRMIKFRGKRISDGKWVYGYLNEAVSPIMIGNTVSKLRIGREFVDPKTVGQYTGLKDRNGREIYEGDVVECGSGHYICEFVEGGFAFRDARDGKLTLNSIVIYSCVIGNIHDNPELLKPKQP